MTKSLKHHLRPGLIVALIISIAILIMLPSLKQFFFSDDWFHLRITQIHSFKQFLNFFSFIPNNQSASFYRPITAQFFFFVFQHFFQLKSIFYYSFGLVILSLNLYLAYRLFFLISQKQKLAIIGLFFYAFSAIHFTHAYFLSAYEETTMFLFVSLSILSYFKQIKPFKKNNTVWSLIFFILALMSKETAVVTPVLILIIDYFKTNKVSKKWLWFIPVLLGYLGLRFMVFGFHHTSLSNQTTYQVNLSPKKAVNTIMWYGLWLMGAPELLIDYVSSGFRILPRLFVDYGQKAKLLLTLLVINIFWFGALFVISLTKLKKKSNDLKLMALGFAITFVGLLPLLPFPTHKFTLELSIPLLGYSLIMGVLLTKAKRWLVAISLALFLSLNLLSYAMTYKTHYTTRRSTISWKVYQKIANQYPKIAGEQYFYFINDVKSPNKHWGVSKQIYLALEGQDFFKVFYKNPNRNYAYYEDIEKPSNNVKTIILKSSDFID